MELSKEAYKAQTEEQLKLWVVRLNGFKATLETQSGNAKVALLKQADELKELETAAKNHLEKVEASPQQDWQSKKGDFEQKWNHLSGSVEALWSRIDAANITPKNAKPKGSPFQLDLVEVRRRAREHMADGAITPGYGADKDQVIEVLNQALATELVCVLRYKNHYYMARGIRGQTCAAEFLAHAAEEQQHADLIAERIAQLGGTPNFNPEGLATRSHSEYHVGESLKEMLVADLVAERIAIETYSAIVRWLGTADPTSRRLMETLLAKEEEHADDLAQMLQDF